MELLLTIVDATSHKVTTGRDRAYTKGMFLICVFFFSSLLSDENKTYNLRRSSTYILRQ